MMTPPAVTPAHHRRLGIVEQVDLGTAEVLPDPKRPDGWVLFVDGVAQSYVDLADPQHLEFEYVRRVASVLDAYGRPGEPVTALHLGGGGLTLARYIAATRPGSKQRVIERDEALAALVGRLLPTPVPEAPGSIDIEIGDARTAVASSPAHAYDIVISDVFQGARMPADVTTVEFAAHVAGTLRPGGIYLVNVTDLPILAFTRRHVATVRTAFGDVCVVADPGMLRGRRFGNVVLAAAHKPGTLPLRRLSAPRPDEVAPGRMLHGGDLDTFVAGARPVRDAAVPDGPFTRPESTDG